MNATTTPTPPPLGVGMACDLRADGWSMTRAPIIARTVIAETPGQEGREQQMAEQGGGGHAACLDRSARPGYRATWPNGARPRESH